ncbi:MAG: pyridoxamine 5'-phosphate oxidase family protein [Myxococcota bacterium]
MHAETDQDRFVEVVKSFGTGMLVTRTSGGALRSRPMGVAEVEPDGTVWFVTSADTPKTEEIADKSEVNVAFQSATTYASLSGRAKLEQDRARIRSLWSEAWRVWFPDGPETSDLVLIGVLPSVGEYWDQRGQKGLRFLWEAAKAYVSGDRIDDDAAERDGHGKVRL